VNSERFIAILLSLKDKKEREGDQVELILSNVYFEK
jgi:hypothetical protein